MGASSSPAAGDTYLLYDLITGACGEIVEPKLKSFTERHKLDLAVPSAMQGVDDVVVEAGRRAGIAGVVVQLPDGIPRRSAVQLASRLLSRGKAVYFYWPAEGAIEVVDRLHVRSQWLHWIVYQAYKRRAGKQGAEQGAVAFGQDRPRAIADLKQYAQTLKSSGEAWQAEVAQLVRCRSDLKIASANLPLALQAHEMRSLGSAVERCQRVLERAIDHLSKTELANNRSGFSLEDLAKLAERPAISGLLDPPHFRGLLSAVQGAGTQLASIRSEIERNIPGFRETLRMVRSLEATQVLDYGAKASSHISENVDVLSRLTDAFDGYLRDVEKSGENVQSVIREAHTLLCAKLAEAEAVSSPQPLGVEVAAGAASIMRQRALLGTLRRRVARVPFELNRIPSGADPLPGTGVYLRTDYWAPIVSGGSYGHTCYQARALARTTEQFIALTANHFPLLDEIGLRQVVVKPAGLGSSEHELVRANEFYQTALRTTLEVVRPTYLFERLCLGNYSAAQICRDVSIPYFVEYNGSEISMKRSFDSKPYELEEFYLDAEQAAFEQATLISVISDVVRDEIVKRGIDPRKVLVNWNAVDLEAYKSPSNADRQALRRELGFSDSDQIVCFIGTFGGWHGVDVLAAALPRVLREAPEARFLLIGDGNHKAQVDSVIEANKIGDRVVCTGRVAQAHGAKLMGAADIFVSPHSRHMVDSRFFGSPTKLFEYMGYGRAIVATDLEQIGEVMRPSIGPGETSRSPSSITVERGLLCRPGNVDEFVAGVVGLVRNPELGRALGRNALKAAQANFTWDAHVKKLWHFAAALDSEKQAAE